MNDILYKCPGKHFGPTINGLGTTYNELGVNSEEVKKAALKQGWKESVLEAAKEFLGLEENPKAKSKPKPAAKKDAPKEEAKPEGDEVDELLRDIE
jgi:hypothetical protein